MPLRPCPKVASYRLRLHKRIPLYPSPLKIPARAFRKKTLTNSLPRTLAPKPKDLAWGLPPAKTLSALIMERLNLKARKGKGQPLLLNCLLPKRSVQGKKNLKKKLKYN